MNARPIPRAAPVIATTLPSSSLIASLLAYRLGHAAGRRMRPSYPVERRDALPPGSGMVCRAQTPAGRDVRILRKRNRPGSAPMEGQLLQGPDRRRREFLQAVRVFCEMIGGFRALHFVGPCVTVFGSARTPEDSPHYRLGMEVGGALAEAGFTVMTGGGPGIMEAASRGAKEAGGRTVGCTIRIEGEEDANPYLDTCKEFNYFFVRKVMLVKYSYGFIVMPAATGRSTRCSRPPRSCRPARYRTSPSSSWARTSGSRCSGSWRETLVAKGMIDPEDFAAVTVTDDAHEAAALIRDAAIRRHGPRFTDLLHRNRLLFE